MSRDRDVDEQLPADRPVRDRFVTATRYGGGAYVTTPRADDLLDAESSTEGGVKNHQRCRYSRFRGGVRAATPERRSALKRAFVACMAVGTILVLGVGCGGESSPTTTISAPKRISYSTGQLSIPLTVAPIPGTGGVRVLIDVSVGGGPSVPVILDTGSAGLFMLSDAIGPNAQPITGTHYDQRYLSGDLIAEKTRAVVAIGGSGRATTPAPIIVGSITSATNAKYVHNLFGSVGAKGILGIGVNPRPGPLPIFSPLVQLPRPLSEGYGVTLSHNADGSNVLVLGRPSRSPNTVSVPLVRSVETYPNGQRAYVNAVRLCWMVGEVSGCGLTVLDTGAPVGLVASNALPGAPRTRSVVTPGTIVSLSTPRGTQLQSFTVATSPRSRALVYRRLFPRQLFTAGVGFFYSDTVGWDIPAGQMVITPSRGWNQRSTRW